MLRDMRALAVTGHRDSLLVLSQVLGKYRYEHESLIQHCALDNMLLSEFLDFLLAFLVSGNNTEVND